MDNSPLADKSSPGTSTQEHRSCLKRTSSSQQVYGRRYVQGTCTDPTTPVGSSTALARKRKRRIVRAILCIIFLVGILVAALALLISHLRTARSFLELCSSPSCRRYVSSLEASMDPGLDPCEDFYAFVCSRWTPDSGGRSFLEDAQLSFEDTVMAQAMSIKTPRLGQDRFQKAVMFYQTCISNWGHDMNYLKSFLQASGVPWPAIDEKSDPLDVILGLSFYWQCPMFIYAYVSSRGPSGHSLKLFDSFMGVDFDAYIEEHRSRPDNTGLVCDLYDLLSDGGVAERGRENQSKVTTRPCEKMAQDQAAFLSQLEGDSERAWAAYSSVYEFASNNTPGIDGNRWVRILSMHTPRGKPVLSITPVDVDNPGYLKALATMLWRTSKKHLLIFIGLTTAQVVGRFMNSRVAGLVHSDVRHSAWKSHATVCYDMTEAAIPGALSSPQPTYLFEYHRVRKATEVAKVVIASSNQRLRGSTWLGAKSKEVITQKIAEAQLVLDGQNLEQEKKVDELPDMTDSFLDNVQTLPSDYWARFHRRSKSTAKRDVWINPWSQAGVSGVLENLTIPNVYMQKRVFPENAYESIYYASLGSLVARKIAAAHDLTGRTIDSEGNERRWLSDDEEAIQDKVIECLVKAFHVRYNGSVVFTPEDKSRLYVAWDSLSPLLDALYFSPGFPEWSSGFRDYSPLQLFFISLCFNMCAHDEADSSILFTGASWCNFPLSLFKPFQESFRCLKGSPMYSEDTCSYDSLDSKGVLPNNTS